MKKVLIAIAALTIMSCEKEEISINKSESNYRLKSLNCLTCNSWQLVESYKNNTSTVGDSSIWTFHNVRVIISGVMYPFTNIGSYVSVGGEKSFKSTIIKLDNDNLELLKTDSTVLVFDNI